MNFNAALIQAMLILNNPLSLHFLQLNVVKHTAFNSNPWILYITLKEITVLNPARLICIDYNRKLVHCDNHMYDFTHYLPPAPFLFDTITWWDDGDVLLETEVHAPILQALVIFYWQWLIWRLLGTKPTVLSLQVESGLDAWLFFPSSFSTLIRFQMSGPSLLFATRRACGLCSLRVT